MLVDPWLEGDLVFAKQTWLYRGQKGALKDVKLDIDAIGTATDVILLSQVPSHTVLKMSALLSMLKHQALLTLADCCQHANGRSVGGCTTPSGGVIHTSTAWCSFSFTK